MQNVKHYVTRLGYEVLGAGTDLGVPTIEIPTTQDTFQILDMHSSTHHFTCES